MGCCNDTRCLYLLITCIAVICVCAIALICVGATVAKPYAETSHFTDTVCTTTDITDLGETACYFGDDEVKYSSQTPCVSIRVTLSRTTDTTEANITLFATVYDMRISRERHLKCSEYSCEEDVTENREVVKQFVQKYGGLNQSYPCFSNPDDPSETLAYVIPQWTVLLGMLLPAGFLLTGILGVILCYWYIYIRTERPFRKGLHEMTALPTKHSSDGHVAY